jgi:hypothetical protein
MMKSTEDRPSSDFTEPLNGTKKRYVLGECKMRPDIVVIVAVSPEDPAQMGFAEDDDVIETFPADRADQPLRMLVLPR